MLLIVGGSNDHNIKCLAEAAEWRGSPCRVIYTDTVPAPSVSWKPGETSIKINGEVFEAEGTSLFIRYDVFSDMPSTTKSALFDAIKGWAIANPCVGMINRGNENLEMNKPRALVLAKICGFETPETWITSDFNKFANKEDYIAKPVSGGDYTKVLSELQDKTGKPYIVQKKLTYPELRLFRVGTHFFAFEISSGLLDYRIDKHPEMKEVTPEPYLVEAMQKLSTMLGLDYAAADLKTNPDTGRLEFLEINTMPMFTGYDVVASGKLSDSLVTTLRKQSQPVPAPKAEPRKNNGPVL